KFPRHTFVQAPFYFQNFLGLLAPQALPNGGRGWEVPMGCAGHLRLLRHLRRVPEIGDQEDSVRAFEGNAEAARLEQIALHYANATLLQRLGRLARSVAADDAKCV